MPEGTSLSGPALEVRKNEIRLCDVRSVDPEGFPSSALRTAFGPPRGLSPATAGQSFPRESCLDNELEGRLSTHPLTNFFPAPECSS